MANRLSRKKQGPGSKDEVDRNKRCLLLTSNDFPIKVTVVPKGMLVKPQELIIDIQPK